MKEPVVLQTGYLLLSKLTTDLLVIKMGGSKSKIGQIKTSHFNKEKLEILEKNYDDFTRNPDSLFNRY